MILGGTQSAKVSDAAGFDGCLFTSAYVLQNGS